jgi:hypothetical protein
MSPKSLTIRPDAPAGRIQDGIIGARLSSTWHTNYILKVSLNITQFTVVI